MSSSCLSALRERAAQFELSSRGRLRITGEDRTRLLHAMSTNHVQQLTPGEGLYAFFLDAQGRILADANILCFPDHFLLDVEPERREFLRDHLDRYIIADDVTVEDVTEETWCIAVEGPKAQAPVDIPARYSHREWRGLTVAAISYTGEHGFRVFGERQHAGPDLAEWGHPVVCDSGSADVVRLEHFKPRYGTDITEKTLPQESQQLFGVHFQKGCYIGQEIVERVRARGHVNRLLMGFTTQGSAAISSGAKVMAEGKEAGEVTSATVGLGGRTFGLAIIRMPAAVPGMVVQIQDSPATLHPPYGY